MPKTKTKNEQRVGAAEPMFRLRWAWVVAALVIATLSLAYPVFAGKFLVNVHSDQYIAGYGFRDFAAQSLRGGLGFPQWNPFLFGGLPYVAAMHGDIFYPTFLLRMIMRTDLAMTWGFIIHLFLAGAFTLGFLRALGMKSWPAAFGALAYMMSGPIASFASPGHDGKLFVSALFPLGLWMLVRAIRDSRRWAWGVFALTVGLAVLSPHPQLLQFMLLASGCFALFLVWQHGLEQRVDDATVTTPASGRVPFDAKFVTTKLGAAFLMVLVGAAIGAVQYWPVLGYVNVSPRANGQDYAFATAYSFPPEELINTYLPQFSGILDAYWGRNSIHLHSEYLGVVVMMLAPLAFGVGSRRALARFFTALGVVSLLWALGEFTPFFHLVYWIIPGTKYFRAPSTIIYLTTFALCVLSALGFERILNGHVSAMVLRRYAFGWLAFGVVMVVLAQSGFLTSFSQSLGSLTATRRGYDPGGFAHFIELNARALNIGAFRSLFVVVLAAALFVGISKKWLTASQFALLLIVTAGSDLWSISHRYWIFSEPASSLYASDSVTDYLKAQKQPGRVFVYAKTSDYRTPYDPFYGSNGFGMGTGLMVNGIRSITGYHGNAIARFETLSNNGGLINPNFWRHENVRWLYTNVEIADSVLKRLDGPTQNSAGSTVYLYAMPGENPYAWVATKTAMVSDSVAAYASLSGVPNAKSFALFDSSAKIPSAVVDTVTLPSSIATTVTRFGAGFADIELSVPAEAGNALVVSENYYPGWNAVVDGKPIPVMRADFNLLGLQLPAGAKKISLTFADPRYPVGKTITWIGLALAVLLIIAGALTQKRETDYSGNSV